ncbi:methionyl-tRNA synthetase [Patellaria atrata CBS 101060]|uniref:methionine--tRNA ligase n=1 Tax=Patellaria atrata CBS 101060 TaxID=1346257 RepID=A0A9P4S3L0_9PEZI|nr:methionyl-tRNA synthetase [Patellaria atrata CBS 101060]
MSRCRPAQYPPPYKSALLTLRKLPYVNNFPHLGNVIGSVLSADVFSRYCKGRGYNSIFVCGSDEYGTASETKALEEGLPVEELCLKYHNLHAEVYKWFEINFSIFGRTPTREQTEIAQDMFQKLWDNGYLEARENLQPYCADPKHQSFLADRFVEGECSICHDPGARGDQCDKCGNLLDPFEPEQTSSNADDDEAAATGYLINPRCKIDNTRPEKRPTTHMYLLLDKLSEPLIDWFKKTSKEHQWSNNCIQITQSWITKGLKPRGITRDLRWGTPIPDQFTEFKNKVMYVWFDACIGYSSITANLTPEWEKWWKNPSHVQLIQFMGKDNVQFHSIIYPATQIGTGDAWTKVHRMSTTEYLNYENAKFSKSKGVGVFGHNAKDTGVAPSVWRYYLLSHRPETNDSEFKWSDFIEANNNDLLKNLGNGVNRVLKFTAVKYASLVPDWTTYTAYPDLVAHVDEVNTLLQTYLAHLEDCRLRQGLTDAMHISASLNKLLQDSKLGNALFDAEPAKCAAVVGLALNQIFLLASVIEPYMPGTAGTALSDSGLATGILQQLGLDPVTRIPDIWTPGEVRPGHRIGTPAYLFTQIKPAMEEVWREMYGGEEVKKQKALAAEKARAKKVAKERERARKAARKAAAGGVGVEGTAAGEMGVEAMEKQQEADPAIEGVTEALGKADVRTS